ncbi:MAG: hypothetical protein RIB98_00355 [Acidimicrobiales bacterium]
MLSRITSFLRLIGRSGISRHGVIAHARQKAADPRLRPPLPASAERLGWVLPASALIGLGVAFLLAADLGLPPFDVWLSAVDQRTPLSHGQAAWASSGLLFGVAAALGVRPTLVSVAFIVANGLAVDIARQIIVPPDTIGVRLAMAAIGIAMLIAGVGLIVHTAATGGAYEAITEAAARRGISPVRFRTGLEVGALAAGVAAGGSFGFVTVIIALGVGPLLAAAMQALADHRAGREARLQSMRSPLHAVERDDDLLSSAS